MAGAATGGVTLTTGRLVLTPLVESDGSPLLALFNLEPIRRYLLDGERVDGPWVHSVIEDSQADFAESGLGLWSIRQPDDASLLGVTGFRSFYEPPVEELLYAVHPDVFGQGIAREAASAAIDHAFASGRKQVRASTDAPNRASLALMARLGFVETHRDPASKGTLWEQVHAALDRGRWQEARRTGS